MSAQFFATVFADDNTTLVESKPFASLAEAIAWVHAEVVTTTGYYDLCFEMRTNNHGEISQASTLYMHRKGFVADHFVRKMPNAASILIQSRETAIDDLAGRAAEGNNIRGQAAALREAGAIS